MLPYKFKGYINRIKINRVHVAPKDNALGERMYFQDSSGLKGSVRMSCIIEHT